MSLGEPRRAAELLRLNIEVLRGDLSRSLTLAEEAARSAHDRGDAQIQAWVLVEEAHVRLVHGQTDEALRLLDEVDGHSPLARGILSNPAMQLWSIATRALGYARRGETENALRVAGTAVDLIKPYLNFIFYSICGFGNLAEACFTVLVRASWTTR